jgi:hypothetical protein
MGRLVVVVDSLVGVSAGELAGAWGADGEASAAGVASVDAPVPGDFLGVVELVVVPLAVNLASSAATALVGRLVARLRRAGPGDPGLEITETVSPGGDRVVVVRLAAGQ